MSLYDMNIEKAIKAIKKNRMLRMLVFNFQKVLKLKELILQEFLRKKLMLIL